MTKYAVAKNCMIGKHVFENVTIYYERDQLIIELSDKPDLSNGVKLN